MNIPNPYFKDVPGYGDLKMEQIIVDYVYPLLSVLKDVRGNRYLCMCFDTREAQQWLVTPILNDTLISLLKNAVTLSLPFEDSRTDKIKIVMDYGSRKETFQLLNASQVPKEELPDPDEYLDAEPGEWDEYIKRIISTSAKEMVSNVVIHYRGGLKGNPGVRWGDVPQQYWKAGRYVTCAVR